MKSKRESGYYWVTLDGCKGWTPVYWCSEENDWKLSPDWWFTGVCEVNESRLQEPPLVAVFIYLPIGCILTIQSFKGWNHGNNTINRRR